MTRITFWSESAFSREGKELLRPHSHISEKVPYPLARLENVERCFHRCRADVSADSTGILQIVSPRPLRLWADGILLLDEILSWRSFQREVRAAVILPGRDAEWNLLWEFGPRPGVPGFVSDDCLSRNREQVLAGIAAQFPDHLRLETFSSLEKGLSAMSLRFFPGQFRRDGVVWQEVVVRPPSPHWNPPRVESGVLADAYFRIGSAAWPEPAHEATTAKDRIGGVRRLYLPIQAPDGSTALLRQAGEPEKRIEPRLEITGKVDVTVVGVQGCVTLEMPVYESLGRLAPVREFSSSRKSFPPPESLFGLVPEPVLPASLAKFSGLYYEAWRMLRGLVRQARLESGLPGEYISTGSAFEHYQFVWDTCFTTLSAAYGWRALPAASGLDLLYSRQQDGGYIHRENDTRDGQPALFEPDFSPNPPLLALAEWRLFRLSGNVSRLKRTWPALVAYHRWIETNRQLPDGTFWTTGLANGLDNSPSLGEGYPDLTAQMAHDAETLSHIADVLGFDAEREHWQQRSQAIGIALNQHLWSDSLQFYSTSLSEGGHNPNKVVTGFWPLWAGVVPPERAAALAAQVQNPDTFGRHHPVPSLAADAPLYEPGGCYWLGSTWAPTNYAVVKGFQRAGYGELARKLAIRHLECVHEVHQATGRFWENYSAEKSAPGNWAGLDYSWTSLGPIASLIEIVLGLEPDAPKRRLEWSPPAGENIGVNRFHLGDATINLIQKNLRQGDIVEIETDAPFTLSVEREGQKRDFPCAPGRTAFSFKNDW